VAGGVPLSRILVIDATLNRRIARELKGRGRAAVAVGELGLGRASDAELLRGLSRRFRPEEWILVTADDYLPGEQPGLVAALEITVATVEWSLPSPRGGREAAARETCHRWAHVMAAQAQSTARRYSPRRHRSWSERYVT
jgi:hypothetical protein